jgi:hypothetical protein
VIRRRLVRQAVLLFVMWPVLVLFPMAQAVSGDERWIPLTARIIVIVPILLPLNIWAAVTALRLHRRLSTHSWRLVQCEVVTPTTHGWRLRERDPASGRELRAQAILCINGDVFRATPFKRNVAVGLTHIWCAGPPEVGAVVSEPGGAGPFRLTRYTGPIGAVQASGSSPAATETSTS